MPVVRPVGYDNYNVAVVNAQELAQLNLSQEQRDRISGMGNNDDNERFVIILNRQDQTPIAAFRGEEIHHGHRNAEYSISLNRSLNLVGNHNIENHETPLYIGLSDQTIPSGNNPPRFAPSGHEARSFVRNATEMRLVPTQIVQNTNFGELLASTEPFTKMATGGVSVADNPAPPIPGTGGSKGIV